MSYFANPLDLVDSYKTGHIFMLPNSMTHLQSNWTPRASRIEGVKKVVFFGLQAYLQRILVEYFNEFFFKKPADIVITKHVKRVEGMMGMPFDASHWYALHKLGYLPLRFSALPEGTEVPLRVPMFIVENTVPGYGWLVNYFESVMSSEIWLPMTSATIAVRYRRMLDKWANKTSDTTEFVDWQGHDFSSRGMEGIEGASASGAGHLLSFAGSDSLSAMDWAEYFYKAEGFVGGSVFASEHSIMTAGGAVGDEKETYLRLITECVPKGIVSIVSDTWDLWYVITKILPQLKSIIMGRDGKLVIRPDSGDPVKIICGDDGAQVDSPPYKGVIELLWDIFGGTVNSKGYKVLDPHIGAIYGDSITYERADEICRRLEAKGFASTNIVLGIGSFTYQYNTRDTLGFAMKATWCMVDGIGHSMFKDPVTDRDPKTGLSIKKSAKGRLAVVEVNGELTLINDASPEDEARSLLKPVWENGKFLVQHTYREIAERLGLRYAMPS